MNAPLAQEMHEPKSVQEAITLLQEKGETAALIAGGTDLVIKLKEGVIEPVALIDITKLPLSYIRGSRARGLRIGALTCAKEISTSAILNKELSVLVDAAIHLGGPQTQEVATIGGNICNASPCANFTNVLVALEASLKIKGPGGERDLPLRDFCRGPGVTNLDTSEMLTEILIPGIENTYGTSYVKHTLRKEMDIAIVGVAVLLIPDGDRIRKIRIALGSVGATVMLAENAQRVMEGQIYASHLVETAAKLAAEKDASYIDDVRSSAAYRKIITEKAVIKALKEAWAMAKGGEK
jgi:carbon-monoxide dehydrogenase medium subunit